MGLILLYAEGNNMKSKLIHEIIFLTIVSILISSTIATGLVFNNIDTEKNISILNPIIGNINTIIVDDEGDGDATSIQESIILANPGDIIEVYSGYYEENIIIDKQISIFGIDSEYGSGSDTGKPIIFGKGNNDVVLITVDSVELDGFRIQNSGVVSGENFSDAGIDISSNNNIISNNTLTGNLVGIFIGDSDDNLIIYNNISNNNIYGIRLYSSDDNVFTNNFISSNVEAGIWVEGSVENTIYYNDFLDSKFNAWVTGLDSINQWDNGTIGNFWSNQWYRHDIDNNGISDIPCYIPLRGIDRFPLMQPTIETPEPVKPDVQIDMPREGYLHIGDEARKGTSGGKTILISLPMLAPLTVEVRANSKYPIDAVLMYVDFDETKPWDSTQLINKMASDLYTDELREILFGTHTLTFVAYDIWGVTSDPVDIEITCFYMPRLGS